MAVTWKKIAYSDQKLDDFGTPDDNTDLNVSTSAHGLAPKLPNDATKYLDGTGAWSVPAGGGGATLTISETEVFNDTAPTTMTDLDLSGTIGTNAALILLKVSYASGAVRVAFRRNGDAEPAYHTTDVPGGTALGEPRYTIVNRIWLETDSSGVIEWQAESAVTIVIDVEAYIV